MTEEVYITLASMAFCISLLGLGAVVGFMWGFHLGAKRHDKLGGFLPLGDDE